MTLTREEYRAGVQARVEAGQERVMRRRLERQGYSPEDIEAILHPEKQAAIQRSQAELERIAAESAAEQEYKKQPWYGGFLETLSGPLEWLHEKVEEPFGAAVSGGLATILPGSQDWLGESAMREAQAKGMSWLESAKTGYRELPGWQRMMTEFANPMWWIPGAAMARPLALGAGALRTTRGLGALGKGMELGARGVLGAERAISYPLARPLEKFFPKRFPTPLKPKQQIELWAEKHATSKALTPRQLIAQLEDETIRPLRIDSMDTIVAQKLGHKDWFKDAAKSLGEVPVMRRLVRLTGGRAATVTPEQVAEASVLGSKEFISRANGAFEVLMAHAKAVGNPVKVLNIDKNAMAHIAGKEIPINDLLRFKSQYKHLLTQQQDEMIDVLRAVRHHVDFLYRTEGVRVKRLRFGDGDEYFHRMATGRELEGFEPVEFLGGRYGEHQIFKTQAEGMANGVKYAPNPIDSLRRDFNVAVRKCSTKRLHDALAPLGRTVREKMPPGVLVDHAIASQGVSYHQQALGAIRAVSKGGTVRVDTMRMLEYQMPDVAQTLTRAMGATSERRGILNTLRQDLLREQRALREKMPFEPGRPVSPLHRKNQEALNVVNRELRGETVPEQTLKTLESHHLQVAERLRGIRSYPAEYQQMLKDAAEGVKHGLVEAEAEMAKTAATKAVAREVARQPSTRALEAWEAKAMGLGEKAQLVTEEYVGRAGLGGRLFPKEIAKVLNESLGKEAAGWLKATAQISGTGRLLKAALDFSAPFIHGIPVLGRNPYVWAKSTLKHYEFFAKPQEMARWMTKPENYRALTEMTTAGSSIRSSEFVEALGKLGPTWGKAAAPFERAFTGYSVAARVELWKGLSPFVPKEQWSQLARSLDRMVGTMSTETLGISAGQKAFEQSFLFFAHEYTRAGLAFIGDMFKGGLAGSEARKALGQLAAGSTMAYLGFCKATGQKADLNPMSANFMTIDVAGRNLGFGGFQYGIMRLLGNIAAAGIDVAEGEKSVWDIVKPIEDGGLNRWDNPFVRFMYGKTSWLTGGIMEVLNGENYFGEPFETGEDWARHLGSKVVPIWIAETLGTETGEPAFHPAIIGAELGGMRTFPRSEWEKIKDLREQYSQSEHGKPWADLNKLEQRQIDEGYEDIKKLRGEWEERLLKRGEPEARYWHEINNARERYEERLADAARGVEAGVKSLTEFRKQAQSIISDYAEARQTLGNIPEFSKVLDKLSKYEPEYIADIAYDDYTGLIYSDDLTDQYGYFNYEEYNRRKNQFREKWGDEIYVYVQERLRVGKDEPPLMREYRRVKEIARPYWEVKSRLLALSRDPDLKKLDELATQIGKRDPQEEQRLRRETPALVKLQRMIEMIHKGMRLRNPELDEILNTWYAW